MGIRADSQIQLITGRMDLLTLRERLLSDETFRPMAICWNGQNLSLTRVLEVRRLGLEQVFSVELDDGSTIGVSPSSEFVMRSGITKSPVELVMGDSLLPLYIGEDSHGYPTYQIPGRAAKRKLSRLSAECKLGHELGRGVYVYHIDGDRKNCHPDNLRITFDQARARRSHTTQVVKAFKEAQALFDECAAASQKMFQVVRKRGKRNHKVMLSSPGLLEEVFTVIVESECSLSGSGVFISLPT